MIREVVRLSREGMRGVLSARGREGTMDRHVGNGSAALDRLDVGVDIAPTESIATVVTENRAHFAQCVVCPWEGGDRDRYFDALLDASEHDSRRHPADRSVRGVTVPPLATLSQ
jgi:hypothetical protein